METNTYGLESVRFKSDGERMTELRRRASDGRYYPFLCHVQSHNGKGKMSSSHVHDVIEFLYCMEGEAEAFLGMKKYNFCAGDLLVINSNETHCVTSLSDGVTKYAVVQFEPEILRAGGEHNLASKYMMPFKISNSHNRRVFGSNDFGKGYIEEIINEILSEYEKKEYGFELAIRSLISRLFLKVLRAWHSEGETIAPKENDDIIMEKVFSYVEQNYMNEIFASSASKISGMSYSYFSRFFKKAAGMSFTEYLNSVRIEKAAEMLTSSAKTVTEIAMDVGFSSTSYFIALFKKQKGITPAAYRGRA
ncbi:MAG: helix-turn-helix domain-containing protein [Clostridia bacterium]|nr:helix-turn-helix domain-containing protein [Clostridia bacterium]